MHRRSRSRQFSLVAAISFVVLGCAEGQLRQFGSTMLEHVHISDPDHLLDPGKELIKAATPVNEEQEYYLGRGVAAVVLSRYSVVKSRTLVAYANRVGAVVAAASGRPEVFGGYHVEVLDTPEVNAISAPGGFIFVTRGLLDLVDSEDELASILAHEVGHIALAHGIKAISRAHLTTALTMIGKKTVRMDERDLEALTALFGKSLDDIVDALLVKGYSRSQEFDADQYALTVLTKAGYPRQALVEMLQALGSVDHAPSTGWFATHPPASDRISKASVAQSVATVEGEEIRTKRFLRATGRKSA